MRFIAILVLSAISLPSFAGTTFKADELKVYMNCVYCYQEYLRTQITWVSFVQDQFVSEIDIMVTTLDTGGGGEEYKLVFTGKQNFSGMTDTMYFTTNAINTDAEIREMLLQRIKLGLVRYAAQTGLLETLELKSIDSTDNVDIGIGSNPSDDPWNAWVFRVNGNANVSAQKVFQNGDFSGSIRAGQVKESHKFTAQFSANYSEQRFEYDGVKSVYILRSQSAGISYIHSLSDHWSAGILGNSEFSDFSNYDYYQSASMAIEYDVFPYKEAQNKLITLSYNIGARYYDFQDTTIYNEISTLVPVHGINIGSSFTQAWGSFSGGIYGSSFLNNNDRYRYGGWINLDVRIFKGLSFSSYASFNVVRDQINIRKSGASDAEVLLRQQELQTDYNLYTYMGISYRFGSIYNNVVNPRFDYSN
jgi:hypothetical protein